MIILTQNYILVSTLVFATSSLYIISATEITQMFFKTNSALTLGDRRGIEFFFFYDNRAVCKLKGTDVQIILRVCCMEQQ